MLRSTTVVTFVGLLLVGQSGLLSAQVESGESPGTSDSAPLLNAYVGAGFGVGLGRSEVTDLLLGGDFAIGLSPEYSLVGGVGYRNLLEIEVRVVDAAYLFRDNNSLDDQTTEIPMDFDAREVMVKVSPPNAGFALVGGIGTVDWYDEAGDGFAGNSIAVGIEAKVEGRGSVMLRPGLLYRTIDYDAASFQGVDLPASIAGSTLTVYVNLLIGTAR